MSSAEKLEERRQQLGPLSYDKVYFRAASLLGEQFTPSAETLRRRYHEVGSRLEPDPLVLGVLCEIYGLDLWDVSPAAAEVLTRLTEHIDKWCGIVRIDLSDQRVPNSSCNVDVWGERPKLFDDDIFFSAGQPTRTDDHSSAAA